MIHKQKTEKLSELEVIFTEPQHSFRWHEHDYPLSLLAGIITHSSKFI